MALFIPRLGATISICAFAMALAGCNAQYAGELSANVAAGSNAEGATPPAASAEAEAPAEKINPTANGVPLPPIRPDFAKLAKEKQEQTTNVAAQTSSPAAEPAQEGTTTVAQYAPSAQQRPTGIFSIFAGGPADPAAPQPASVQMASAPTATSDAPVQRASIAAYERRMSGEAEEDEPVATPASYKIAQGAVVEVAGVTRQLPASSLPTLVTPSPRIAGAFGAMGGQNWRPAYDNVVTNCFGPDLRSALENIARHFNSEVLVTSGHRTNGRRKSMHRFCRAADIRIVGVSPGTVANYASSVPGIKGVGTYRRVAVTHIDTRENQMAWRY